MISRQHSIENKSSQLLIPFLFKFTFDKYNRNYIKENKKLNCMATIVAPQWLARFPCVEDKLISQIIPRCKNTATGI